MKGYITGTMVLRIYGGRHSVDGSHHTHTIHFIIVIVTLATSPPNFFYRFIFPASRAEAVRGSAGRSARKVMKERSQARETLCYYS